MPSPSAASATASPSNTALSSVWVGNTDGEGVFLRGSPVMSDRLSAYPDGTELRVTGPEVSGDGTQWLPVLTPDGTEGYVPSEYTVDHPPTPTP